MASPARGYSAFAENVVEQNPFPVGIKRRGSEKLPFVVSLFCGAGGLDWGFREAGFKISLAIDASVAAIQTHRRNFEKTESFVADLSKLGPSGVLSKVREVIPCGERIGVIGGPPCQGFSRANPNSQTDDPRNKLASLYLDIISMLQQHYTVEFVVFENVLGIRDKKHAPTFEAIKKKLMDLKFDLTERELCALDFGVPQIRRRLVLSALRRGQGYVNFTPHKRRGLTSVREAIEGLNEPIFFRRGLDRRSIPVHPNHWTMMPKSARFANPGAYMKSGRSFRRLSWEEPSPTVAYGHREIHVHPNGHRRISVYEAMLLQGFPTNFILEGNLSAQVEQVSNAVPPPLAKSVASAIKRALKKV